MSTTAAIDRFLEHGGLSDASRRAYGSDLTAFARWLDERGLALDDVDAQALADWVAELGSGRPKLATCDDLPPRRSRSLVPALHIRARASPGRRLLPAPAEAAAERAEGGGGGRACSSS